jgi:CheY-like chemotaxis protein
MGKILIADDNELNARILTDILCIEGYDCVVVNSDEKAIELFSASEIGEFSIVLLDIQMQRLDGWSAVKKIRSLDRSDSSSVLVYALAESYYKDDAEYAHANGIDLFLSDPINLEEILFNLRRDIK